MNISLSDISLNRTYFNKYTGKKSNSLLDVYSENKLSLSGLKFFLDFGYIPGKETLFDGIEVCYEKSPQDIVYNLKKRYEPIKGSFAQNVYNGGELFNRVIDDLYKINTKPIVLPITSGLDSRMILGGLLECTQSKNITAFTWAQPGSFDFEIGKKMCNSLGVKHHAMDITKYELTNERLKDFAYRTDCSVALFDHWPVFWVKELVEQTNGAMWMGLMGGTLSGSNFPYSFAENPLSNFLNKEQRNPTISSLSIPVLGQQPNYFDMKRITENFKTIDYDVLDICFHHLDLIVPTKIHKDFDYVLPFLHSDLVGYFLNLPKEDRFFRKIFKEMIIEFYPKLANFPTHRTGGFGLDVKGQKRIWLNRFRKKLPMLYKSYSKGKYLSVKNGLNYNTISKEMVEDKLDKLERRGIIKNENLIPVIKSEFFGGQFFNNRDHSRVIDKLVSLEIILELVDYK